MDESNEEYRLRSYSRGEVPDRMFLTLIFKTNQDEECLSRIMDIMHLIVKAANNQWPTDEYWRNNLPNWLLRTFKTYSPEELSIILADKATWVNLDWTLGSWLDRMKEREWEWWSLQSAGDQASIRLMIHSYPISIKPFEHLVKASGGHGIVVE